MWQSLSVQGQLNAALTSNRAWVSIDPEINTPITFDFGEGQFGLTIKLKNVGKSPATEIRVAATGSVLISGHPYSARETMAAVCKKASDEVAAPVMLFPDETHDSRLTVQIGREDLARGTIRSSGPRGDAVIPLLHVCAVYDDAGSGSKGARTAFAYTIGIRADKPYALKTIPIDGDEIRLDTLVIRRDFIGGGLAD